MQKIRDWLFNNEDGRMIVTQRPNWQLMSALGLWLLALAIDSQPYNDLLTMFYRLVLLYWASLEIRLGINHFRNTLGTIVFVVVLLSLLEQLL